MDTSLEGVRRSLRAAREETRAALSTEKTRRRGALIRHLHEINQMLDPAAGYASQAGQDRVIDRLLGEKSGGTFVDVGGYDGVTGSNTLFLEQRRNWTGILIEPVAAHLDTARSIRRCTCLACAVSPEEGKAEFLEIQGGYTQMSGLLETYDPALLHRVREDQRHRETLLSVETRPLSSILIETKLPHPDYVSLDIEGGERAVLESFPFSRHRISAWSIENNTGKSEINRIMTAQGYDLVEFCGPDEIYFKSFGEG
jgi:FkbM family methyltransferase